MRCIKIRCHDTRRAILPQVCTLYDTVFKIGKKAANSDGIPKRCRMWCSLFSQHYESPALTAELRARKKWEGLAPAYRKEGSRPTAWNAVAKERAARIFTADNKNVGKRKGAQSLLLSGITPFQPGGGVRLC